jgi:hypothetical protein
MTVTYVQIEELSKNITRESKNKIPCVACLSISHQDSHRDWSLIVVAPTCEYKIAQGAIFSSGRISRTESQFRTSSLCSLFFIFIIIFWLRDPLSSGKASEVHQSMSQFSSQIQVADSNNLLLGALFL